VVTELYTQRAFEFYMEASASQIIGARRYPPGIAATGSTYTKPGYAPVGLADLLSNSSRGADTTEMNKP